MYLHSTSDYIQIVLALFGCHIWVYQQFICNMLDMHDVRTTNWSHDWVLPLLSQTLCKQRVRLYQTVVHIYNTVWVYEVWMKICINFLWWMWWLLVYNMLIPLAVRSSSLFGIMLTKDNCLWFTFKYRILFVWLQYASSSIQAIYKVWCTCSFVIYNDRVQ